MSREQGVDWAKYQGNEGLWGLPTDTFSIAQIGGTYNGALNSQTTYDSQVAATLKLGRRAHTYIWYQVGGSQVVAKACLDYFLPRIKTPKGSIVALDYEEGASGDKAANTAAILYGMRRIKEAGYTPMYYGYKPFTLSHVNYHDIIREFPNSLWIAAYPDYAVRTSPLYAYFPSMDGVAIWQFTSTYKEDGLDGNVDLTGITKSGYTKKSTKPKKEADDMPAPKKRPAGVFGIAYAREDTKTSKGATIKKGSEWKAFAIKEEGIDIGGATAPADKMLVALNPLHSGGTATVENAKAVKLSTGKTLQPGKWKAFGVSGDSVDLGGGQTADVKDFTIKL